MTHALTWFEIPVSDMERASKFYGAVLAADLTALWRFLKTLRGTKSACIR